MNTRKFSLSQDEQRALQEREAATDNGRELKRLQAVRLYGSGKAMGSVVEVIGRSSRTIQRWVMDYQAEGLRGLRPGWQGQNAKKLSDEQRADVVQRLQQYRPDQILSSAGRVSQGEFWTVSDVQVAVQTWHAVAYRSQDSYRAVLYEAGLSYQRTEGVYRSKPHQVERAAFEQALEKKGWTFCKPIPTAGL